MNRPLFAITPSDHSLKLVQRDCNLPFQIDSDSLEWNLPKDKTSKAQAVFDIYTKYDGLQICIPDLPHAIKRQIQDKEHVFIGSDGTNFHTYFTRRLRNEMTAFFATDYISHILIHWPYNKFNNYQSARRQIPRLKKLSSPGHSSPTSYLPIFIQFLAYPLYIGTTLYLSSYKSPLEKHPDEIAKRVVSQALTAGMSVYDFENYTGYSLQDLINKIYHPTMTEDFYFMLSQKFQIRIDPSIVIPEFESPDLNPFLLKLFETWGGSKEYLSKTLHLRRSEVSEIIKDGITEDQYGRLLDGFERDYPGDY